MLQGIQHEKTLFNKSCDETGLRDLAKDLVFHLTHQPKFCLWLQGELGAGKTSLAREFLYELGLSESQPVQSPTFSIVNEYQIGGKNYAHMDLYRLHEASELDELGLTPDRIFSGMIVEWPERALEADMIKATHSLIVEKSDDLLSRRYTLFAVKS